MLFNIFSSIKNRRMLFAVAFFAFLSINFFGQENTSRSSKVISEPNNNNKESLQNETSILSDAHKSLRKLPDEISEKNIQNPNQVMACVSPSNENCSGAISLGTISTATTVVGTYGCSSAIAATSMGWSQGGDDVWYSFTVPAGGGTYSISITAPGGTRSAYPQVAVLSTTNCSTVNVYAANDNLIGNGTSTTVTLSVGCLSAGTYYIAVDGANGYSYYGNGVANYIGSFTMVVTAITSGTPSNDCCSNATTITMNSTSTVGSYTGTATGTTAGATADGYNSFCFNRNRNVWYKFVAPTTGSYFVDLMPGTIQYGELSVTTTGCSTTNYNDFAGGSYECAGYYSSAGNFTDSYNASALYYTGYSPVSFDGGRTNTSTYSYTGICSVTAGTTVYIMVDTWISGTPGTFTVNVYHLKNDDLTQPLIIDNCGSTFNSSTIGSTNCGNGAGSAYNNLDNNTATACSGTGAASCGNGSGGQGNSCAASAGSDVGYSVENDSWYEFCVVSNATVTLTFVPNVASCLSTGTSALQISVFTGTTSNFTKVAGGYCGESITSSTTYTFAMAANVCAFVEVDGFAGTNCDYSLQTSMITTCVLPVEMMFFKGELTSDIASKLNWATATEKNADYYLVEKSIDGVNYTELTKTKAVGNSTTLSNYTVYDKYPSKGLNYYKLTEFDKNGVPSFFGYATVSNNAALQIFNVYPNPAQDAIILNLKNFATPVIGYELYNSQGELVKTDNISLTNGDAIYNLDLNSLQKGIYFVKLNGAEGVLRKTFIKQ